MILLLLLALTSSAEARPATQLERDKIVRWARTYFADSHSLRGTGISDVRQLQGYRGAVIENGICVTLNAKNQLGGYTGIDTYVFVVPEPGRLQYGDARWNVSSSTCRVEGVSYTPFPELGAIK